jgi:predicted aspartyl protease
MFLSRWSLFFVLFLGVLFTTKAVGDTNHCSTPISIPVKLHHGVPFVQVMVNGRGPFTFIVDTGTNRAVIVSPSLAKALKMPFVGQTYLVDLSGKFRERVTEVAVSTISVAGREFHPGRALVHRSLETVGSYDGILGFGLFKDMMLTLDYPQRCMELSEGDLAGAEGENVMPLMMTPIGPMTMLTVGDQAVMAVVDTGGGGLNLPESVAHKVEFDRCTEVVVREQTQVNTTYFHGGEMKGQLRLGGYVFKDPFVSIDSLVPFASIGSAPLQDFVVTFDQKHQLVRFEARKNAHRVERSQLPSWVPPREVSSAGSLGFPAGGK